MASRVSARTLSVPAARRQGAYVGEMQRRRLLTAMRDLLANDGLDGVTVGAVCDRARVSRRTFYDLFADREACTLAVFEESIEQIRQRVLPVVRGEERWREQIRTGLQALLAVFDEQPALARLCVIETLKAGPTVLQRRREVIDALIVLIAQGRGEARSASEPPALTAESTVGGVLAVIHARLLDPDPEPLTTLTGPLMGMIVHPYLGPAASKRESERAADPSSAPARTTAPNNGGHSNGTDPFRDLRVRITYRTALVLTVIAEHPGVNNRQISDHADVPDQGQISKLLRRLQNAGLIEDQPGGRGKGEAYAWQLTQRGRAVHGALAGARGA